MSKENIADIISKQIKTLTALAQGETDITKKVYYFHFLSTLEHLRDVYERTPYNKIYGDSSIRKELQKLLLNKELTLIDTIEESKNFIFVLSEAVLEYINSTSSYNENKAILQVDENNFSCLIIELMKGEGLDSIYRSNMSKEILDFANKDELNRKNFSASYNLLSLEGQFLVMINENKKNLNSLLDYSHEYGHFLTDYLFEFDLAKKSCKNHAYNEVLSEILRMKLRKLLIENNYMSFEREKQEEISFVTYMIIMYMYSHYDLIDNENYEEVVKQAEIDINLKYPKIKVSFNSLTYDQIINAYMYGLAKYVGNLYVIKDINILKARDIILQGSNNPIASLASIGLDEENFMDKEIIKNNLSKILMRR